MKPALALLAAAALACGSGGSSGPPPAPPAPLPEVPKDAWTWVDVPGSRCDDGSETGLGVSPGDGPDLLVFLNGGGACWNHLFCAVLDTSTHGPYRREEFQGLAPEVPGSIFDRADPTNPFRAFTMVFVPYCTGDVHSGDRETVYSDGQGSTVTMQHRGRANALLFAGRIAATFPQPRRLVVAGSSGGGYGTAVNYDAIRARFPGARGYAIDDSGPALRDLPAPPLREAWWQAWGTPATLATFCPECVGDLSAVWPALSRRWPGDRFALLSSLQDRTMVGYLFATPASLEAAVLATARGVIAPLPNVETFLVPGDSHTMLAEVASFEARGTPLREWLRQMIDDDPAWTSRAP